mgnify:CR=1 FL=1
MVQISEQNNPSVFGIYEITGINHATPTITFNPLVINSSNGNLTNGVIYNICFTLLGKSGTSGTSGTTVTTDTIIDQFPVANYRTAKYIITANNSDGYQSWKD